MRYLFGFLCVCALGVMPLVGCSETTGDGGSGGSAGDGGSGGSGGGTGDGFPCTEEGIREAIAEGGGPHRFACDGAQTVTTDAEIVIDNDVALDGEGKLTVDGDGAHRVFSVPEGVTAELRGLVVTNGAVSNDVGGGILNEGMLTLTSCTVSENTANVGPDGYGDGGGVFNEGTLTLTDCTVSGNSADDDGGGIMNTGLLAVPDRGVLTVTNSTLSANTARFGGGIWNGKTTTLTNSTLSGNTAVDFGGGISSIGALIATNSTFSENTAGVEGNTIFGGVGATLTGSLIKGDCSGPLTSNGYNIESPGNTCGFDQQGDQAGVTPEELNLGELADNDGPTMTHKPGDGGLRDGSDAIDAIPAEACLDADGKPLTTDQRGLPRPAGPDPKQCDVGSVEVRPED